MLETLSAWLGAPAFTLAGYAASRAELLGAVLGLCMAVCNIRVNPLAWPLGIASAALYALVFHNAGLQGNALLQGLFITVSLWGWWQWLRGRGDDGRALRVGLLPTGGRALAVGTWLLLWPLVLVVLYAERNLVNAADAFTTAGSVVAQVMLARKRVENWWAWIGVNVVGVLLFAGQQLWLTALLYTLFLITAVIGARAWRRLAAA